MSSIFQKGIRQMTELYVTNQIPENATILVTTVEKWHLDYLLDSVNVEKRGFLRNKIDEKLDVMKNKLSQLKEQGHRIVSANVFDVCSEIKDMPHEYMKLWDDALVRKDIESTEESIFPLNQEIVKRLENEEKVIVCGLWEELYVLKLSQILQKQLGSKILLYTGKDLTFNRDFSEDDFPLNLICHADQITIKKVA